ncbi:MAG TPA: S8 family serine peptidase [Caulobacteraceae bacterium]
MALKPIVRVVKLAAVATVSLAALASQAHAQQSSGGPITPYYGNIHPFYGNIHPFYGNIHPFYGNIHPFYGNIHPFWGDTGAFWGSLQPFAATKDQSFWGSLPGYTDSKGKYDGAQVGAFWNTEGAKYDAIVNAWGTASSASDFAHIDQMLQGIVSDASSFWGPEAKKVGKIKDFSSGFAAPMLAGYGIDLSDPSTLANLDQSGAAAFLLDWYDGLMSFSGAGHVDWWMGATGWSPALAQTEANLSGHGDKPVSIGMLDFTVSASAGPGGGKGPKNPEGTVLQYGSSEFGDGHGAAVGSLIMSSVDGSNIMGVLPAGDAAVTVYDPYDSTGTTNWTDVGKGVDALTQTYFQKSGGPTQSLLGLLSPLLQQVPLLDSLAVTLGGALKIAPAGANIGVINASLGEPGWTLAPGWNTALASGSAKYSILVVAAGNDGVVQPRDIAWNFKVNPTLLVVGSVGLDGTISNFSNTPGDTCLNDATTGACDPLKNHFLVAPGELILVSDGEGGISRQTGTSLAAPLVTGAIGLLQARWPWLGSYPNETASIILQSATPIHSPGYTGSGPDPVYGWGELNIAASQAPLNWRNMVYLKPGLLGIPLPVSVNQVVAQVQTGNQTAWNSSKLYFTALERIGNTYRDFYIPLASSLVGQNIGALAGQQMFQSYLTGPLKTWVAGGAQLASTRDYDPATASFVQSSQSMGQLGDAQLRVRMNVAAPTYGFSQHTLPVNMDFALVGQSQTMQFGFGDGAAALSSQPGLTGGADFQLGRGGANPLLGLASGGAYANWRLSLVKNLTFSFGATDRRSVRDAQLLGPLGLAGGTNLPGQVYAADAENFGLDYAANKQVTLHASFTRLREDSGLLGVQSLQAGALDNGSVTRAASVGVDVNLTRTLMLSGSASMANTSAGGLQALTTSPGGLTSTAAEIAVTKAGLFSANDRLRLTLSKPMQVVAGQIQYTDFGVVDRQTGALGQIVESAGASNGQTPFAAELFYGRMLKNDAEASVFMRAGVNTDQFGFGPRNDYMVGYRYKLAF